MKPVFSEEVARELGYQKYWPEKSDWVKGTVFCLAVGVIAWSLVMVVFLWK